VAVMVAARAVVVMVAALEAAWAEVAMGVEVRVVGSVAAMEAARAVVVKVAAMEAVQRCCKSLLLDRTCNRS